jgi:hypothetical protein
MDGKTGHSWRMKQGLPQGSVLSPLLFLFYIDTVREVIPKGVNVSMYADDLALYALHHQKEVAQAAIQAAVDAVEQWSKNKKLKLNAAKCEVAFFSKDPGEAGWKPQIVLNGTTLTFNGGPTFLGLSLTGHCHLALRWRSSGRRWVPSATCWRWWAQGNGGGVGRA